MRSYYDEGGIVIYHGDCREILPSINSDVMLSDPPYPNNGGHFDSSVQVARDVLCAFRGRHALIFWNELERPPVPLPLVAVHVWHRTNVNGRPYEPIYQFDASGIKKRSEVKRAAAVFRGVGPGCSEYLGHPTQKNSHVMAWLVAKTKGVILDPFMGSGTTLQAASELGRRAIGIEIEERYCEIAAKRLSQGVLQLEQPA
jgi:site-specific DNA-methyltransferase (adenine-specific)